MNFSKIKYLDISNGEGVRTSLFTQGCHNYCNGCFNPETWNPRHGRPFTHETLEKILDSIDKPYVQGLSLLGGDPLHPANISTVKEIVVAFRERFRASKDVWMWTGSTYSEIMNDTNMYDVFSLCDVVVDGRFEIELKNLNLAFRGSSNQSVIDVKESIDKGCMVYHCKYA